MMSAAAVFGFLSVHLVQCDAASVLGAAGITQFPAVMNVNAAAADEPNSNELLSKEEECVFNIGGWCANASQGEAAATPVLALVSRKGIFSLSAKRCGACVDED